MKDKFTLREIIKKEFDIDLPISGGSGISIDDAIVIDKENRDWSDIEYTCLKYINQLLSRTWKVVETKVIEKEGRQFDQLKLAVEGDNENYYNYYFDITDHL